MSAVGNGAAGPVIALFTNGGPHPAHKWAGLAAQLISDLIEIDERSTSIAANVGRQVKPGFINRIELGLIPIFDAMMAQERELIANGSVKLRDDPFTVENFSDEAAAFVIQKSRDTPFYFAGISEILCNVLKQCFIDAANVQRLWIFDQKGF